MDTTKKEISKDNFLTMCEEYAGPKTVAYWTDFLSKDFMDVSKEDWKFVVAGNDKPIPPSVLLDVATRVESKTIAAFFTTEEDIRSRYGS